MTATAAPRSFYRATIGDLTDLLMDQPHQALLSVASITLIAAEAGQIVPMPANIALAVGVEWAFLRGAASARRVRTRWLHGLNGGAAAVLLIYGSLWSLRKFEAIPASPDVVTAWALTILHIVPVFWLTLCAAQAHAAMLRSEAATAQAADLERRMFELQQEEKERDLNRWKDAQQFKAEQRRADAAMRPASASNAGNARQERTDADARTCPKCGAALAQAQWLAARRWGHCATCKPKKEGQ